MISMTKEIMKCSTSTQINENTTHSSNEQNLQTIVSTVQSIKCEPITELTSNLDTTEDSSRTLESDPNISSSNLEPIDTSSEALDQIRNSQTLKSPFKRPVNESIDENDNNCKDISSPKRLKTDETQMTSNNVMNYIEIELKKLLETYLDHVLELFFLQEFGNIMEFQLWRRKQPNPQLLQYLRNNCVDTDEEFKELIDLKTSIDFSSAKPSETIPLVQVLQSNSSASRVTTPSVPSQLKVNSSSTVSIPSISTQSTSVSTSAISTVPKVNSTTTTSLAITTTTISNARNHSNQLVPGVRLTTRQHSISSFYVPAIGSQEQIVERAKQEAYVMQRIAELRKNGLWSSRRLPKVQEPPRIKVHWDYLLEEMQWLAADFAQERKWKKAAAKKCSRMVMKYHSDKKCHAERAEKEEYLRLRKIASNIAKQIKQFWSDIEKVFEAKQEVRLKEKRKKLHDMHLNLIVDKADKYTERLTQEFGKSLNSAEDSGLELTNSQTEEAIDSDFEPENNESDDEETIAKEEEEVGIGDGKQEIELLQKESEIPLEDLKASLPKEIFEVPATLSPNSSEPKDVVEDQDFKVDEESINAEDDEETIQEEEEKEGKVDYTSEINELETDANLPIEELIKKYASLENYALDSDDDQMEAQEDYDEDNSSEDYDNENEDEEDFGEDMSTEEETGEIGMEFLINPEANEAINKPLIEEICDKETNDSNKTTVGPNKDITDIAANAESLQPKGNTLSTNQVCTKIPHLLKHTLREYQHIGLDWLVAMRDKKLNGILADEMGLGKTIQTIALIAHLAVEKGIWGPHLIVVPTSVMLNWEMEFKKWCPAFKILTYYGSPKERKLKRQGWTKPNQFHVCITSYKLVIQDHQSFRRKKWKYLILDEAQHIKNFKSQRWQMLLNFNTSRRLLLTGTPLQNNLMELWSLMHFLMPNVFQSHKEFKDWFVNPVTGMIEGNNEFNEGLIRRLHKVLRPFLLRRLKCDVEKQLPKKYEHVVMCRLSKRQRFLYEEFMSLGKTKDTLATGNFLSVINILMQLRKVCNHPNLFDPRPTISPFMTEALTYQTASLVTTALDYDPLKHINLKSLNLLLSDLSFTLSAFAHHRIARFMASPELIQEIDSAPEPPPRCPRGKIRLQIRTSTATMHSTMTSPKSVTTPTSPSSQAGNRQIEQKYLIAHNTGIQSPNGSTTSKLSTTTSTTTTSTSDGNRVAIPVPLGRLVQTSTGPHILLRTSTGTPISSTLSPTTTIVRQSQLTQSPMRQIIVTRTMQPVGMANSQEQSGVTRTTLTASSKSISSPFRKTSLILKQQTERKEKLKFLSHINTRKCSATAMYASDLIEVATINNSPKFLCHSIPFGSSVFSVGNGHLSCLLAPNFDKFRRNFWDCCHALNNLIKTPEKLVEEMSDTLTRFVCIVPRVISPQIRLHASHLPPSKKTSIEYLSSQLSYHLSDRCNVLNIPISQMRTQFPELRLIQYDCGKLQTLDKLLWELKTYGHRVLIFTQMSRMLDIFEQFLNYHGHTYLRLDGTTKIEQRQALMERFNADKRIFCFILSTRSGGIGVNLTGADTVIFYDSDWNPTMDAQAQDRCHRIGQTRDVHIYRLISEMTVEENILKKAQQKKLLGSVAIEGGNFTTAFFKRNAIQELFGIDLPNEGQTSASSETTIVENTVDNIGDAQFEQALCTAEEDNDVAAAKTARAEAAAEFAEFDENIPIDIDGKEEEKSAEEEKIDELIEQLKPVEKYAMKLLEVLQESVSFDQLKQAEEEIEAHKKEWELRRLQSEQEESLKLKAALDDEKEPILAYDREDAYNQVKKRSKTGVRSKLENEFNTNLSKTDRQNYVKSNQNTANKANNCINPNKSSKAKQFKLDSNNLNDIKSQVRRSPRSPISVNNLNKPSKKLNDNSYLSSSKSNHIMRSRSRTSNSMSIANGSEASVQNASNALKRNR